MGFGNSRVGKLSKGRRSSSGTSRANGAVSSRGQAERASEEGGRKWFIEKVLGRCLHITYAHNKLVFWFPEVTNWNQFSGAGANGFAVELQVKINGSAGVTVVPVRLPVDVTSSLEADEPGRVSSEKVGSGVVAICGAQDCEIGRYTDLLPGSDNVGGEEVWYSERCCRRPGGLSARRSPQKLRVFARKPADLIASNHACGFVFSFELGRGAVVEIVSITYKLYP